MESLALRLVVLGLSVRADENTIRADAGNTAWTVTYNGQTLCVYTYAPDQVKPYVRELAPLGGTNLLRDSPFDHKHHHALMYAIRVNGVNFWEETPGRGVEKPVGGTSSRAVSLSGRPGFAEFRHKIQWLSEADAKQADTAPWRC